MSISFIVATSVRPTVEATLRSIECWPGDEILLVSDAACGLYTQEYANGSYVRHIHCLAGNDWGHAERNFAMPLAKGQYITHIDDDDVYVPNHRALMEEMLQQHHGRPIIFKMQYPTGQILWNDKIIRCGNVGTPMSLVPNDPTCRGEFGSYYGGDLFYLESYAGKAGYASEDFVWREEVVVLIRPHNIGKA